MTTTKMSEVIQHLRRAVLLQDGAGLTDRQLLECFISSREEAAIAALVRRHGPMVWAVCHRVLRNHHDAEDAFQATFLVLVRKAASIVSREMFANWLYGVAHQTALNAKQVAANRRRRERQVMNMPEPKGVEQDRSHDLQLVLDQELSRLPDKYRAVIVLCDLQGKTHKEAARQLGVPEGTIASRKATAREKLAKRLARHGLALVGGSLAAALSTNVASASLPTSVLSSTIKAVTLVAAGKAAAGVISANVATLTEGVMKAMLLTKLKAMTGLLLLLSMVTLTSVMLALGQTGPASRGDKGSNSGERPAVKVEKQAAQVQTKDPPKDFTNSIGMKFVWIPPGNFLMGSPKEELQRWDNETQHKVMLTKGFYMSVYTVTQEQWKGIMGNNPSHFKDEKNLPVENVSWDDCQEFIKKLREKDKKHYRLPTEAEWEYACRAGTTTTFSFGETISTDQANYFGGAVYGNGKKGVYRKKTTAVGSFPANAWGLHDMHGNVWQWCQDFFGDYQKDEVVDPQGPKTAKRNPNAPRGKDEYRVLRGGAWGHDPEKCRSACRGGFEPGYRGKVVGFRLCFGLDDPASQKGKPGLAPQPNVEGKAEPNPPVQQLSKPVKADDLEFELVADSIWSIGKDESKANPVHYELRVTNHGKKDVRFLSVVGRTPMLKDAEGKELPAHFLGQDSEGMAKPVTIEPGKTVIVKGLARLHTDDKGRRLSWQDEFGAWWRIDGVKAGKYSLRLHYDSLKLARDFGTVKEMGVWLGDVRTAEVSIVVVEEQPTEPGKADPAKQKFDAKVKQAKQALLANQYAEAAKTFDEAIALLPDNPSVPDLRTLSQYAAAMSRGEIQASGHDFTSAISAYQIALKAIPGDSAAAHELANAHAEIEYRMGCGICLCLGEKYSLFTGEVESVGDAPKEKGEPEYVARPIKLKSLRWLTEAKTKDKTIVVYHLVRLRRLKAGLGAAGPWVEIQPEVGQTLLIAKIWSEPAGKDAEVQRSYEVALVVANPTKLDVVETIIKHHARLEKGSKEAHANEMATCLRVLRQKNEPMFAGFLAEHLKKPGPGHDKNDNLLYLSELLGERAVPADAKFWIGIDLRWPMGLPGEAVITERLFSYAAGTDRAAAFGGLVALVNIANSHGDPQTLQRYVTKDRRARIAENYQAFLQFTTYPPYRIFEALIGLAVQQTSLPVHADGLEFEVISNSPWTTVTNDPKENPVRLQLRVTNRGKKAVDFWPDAGTPILRSAAGKELPPHKLRSEERYASPVALEPGKSFTATIAARLVADKKGLSLQWEDNFGTRWSIDGLKAEKYLLRLDYDSRRLAAKYVRVKESGVWLGDVRTAEVPIVIGEEQPKAPPPPKEIEPKVGGGVPTKEQSKEPDKAGQAPPPRAAGTVIMVASTKGVAQGEPSCDRADTWRRKVQGLHAAGTC